jgi:hypothetical protein
MGPPPRPHEPSAGHVVGGGEWMDMLQTPSWVKPLRALASEDTFRRDLLEAGRRPMLDILRMVRTLSTTTTSPHRPMVSREEKRALRDAIDQLWNGVRRVLFEYRLCDEIRELDASRIMKDLMGRLVSYLILRERGADWRVTRTTERTLATRVAQACSRYISQLLGSFFGTGPTMAVAGVELTLQEIVEIMHYKSIIDKHAPLVYEEPNLQQGGVFNVPEEWGPEWAPIRYSLYLLILVLVILWKLCATIPDPDAERRRANTTALRQSFDAAYDEFTQRRNDGGPYWTERLRAWTTRLASIARREPLVLERLYAKRDDIPRPSDDACVICFHAERTVLLSKCLHLVLCDTCVRRLFVNDAITCPMCRTKQERRYAMPLLEYLYDTNTPPADIIMNGGCRTSPVQTSPVPTSRLYRRG